MLVAGLLWSSVCVAQCRVSPSQATAKKHSKTLHPCHQQEQDPAQDDRKDEGCSISYTTDAEKSTDTAVDFALLSALEPVTLLSIAIYDPRFVEIRIATRPSDSVSILRI